MSEVWYRYEDSIVSSFDTEYEYVVARRVRLDLIEYRVIKHTPKGVWLELGIDKRLVLRHSRKRFACPTKEEALESFIARKECQIRILEDKLKMTKSALAQAQHRSSPSSNGLGSYPLTVKMPVQIRLGIPVTSLTRL